MMPRATRFVLVLVGGLAALSMVGYYALTRTTRDWFEMDLTLRSRLAVASAHQSLLHNWSDHGSRLGETLDDITRDERIMASAACSMDGDVLAATTFYPAEFSCRSVLVRMQREVGSAAS